MAKLAPIRAKPSSSSVYSELAMAPFSGSNWKISPNEAVAAIRPSCLTLKIQAASDSFFWSMRLSLPDPMFTNAFTYVLARFCLAESIFAAPLRSSK